MAGDQSYRADGAIGAPAGPTVAQVVLRVCYHSDVAEEFDDLQRSVTAGDDDAVDRMVARFLPRLHAYVRVHMGPGLRRREASVDVVQSVCREVLLRQDGFEYRGDAAFRGWMVEIAGNKIRDRLKFWGRDRRDAGREVELSDGASLGALAAVYRSVASPSRAAVRVEEIEMLEQALERLDDEDREVIALCHLLQLPREQVGVRMGGKSATAVRSHLQRALVRLSTELERLGLE